MSGRVLPNGSVRLLPKGRIEALPGFDARRVVGAGRRGLAAGASHGATSRASAYWIFAPRPAARRRSSRLPAPRSSPSTFRRRGSRCSPQISPDSVLPPPPSPPTPRPGRLTSDSTRFCSTRPAHRPAPFAATPTSPISNRRRTSRSWPRLQARLLDNAASLLKPGGTLVYSTCSLELEEGEAQIAALLARNPEIKVDPILPEERVWAGGLATVPGLLEDFSLSARPRDAGMERHGRIFRRAPEPQQIAITSPT